MSHIYKVLTTTQPPCLLCSTSQHSLFVSGYPRSTTNIILVTYSMTDRCIWNQLPSSLHQPHSIPSVSDFPVYVPTTFSHFVNSPLSPSITSLSLSLLAEDLPLSQMINLSHHRLPSGIRTDSTNFITAPFLLSISFFCF